MGALTEGPGPGADADPGAGRNTAAGAVPGRTVASDWERAGLYDPTDPRAEERRALLELLTGLGATIEQMVAAHAVGALPGLAGNLVTQGSAVMLPVKEIAQRHGVPVARVLRVLQAAGIPATEDDEISEDLAELMTAFEQGAALMGEEAVLAFTRVLGSSAISIAEAAVALVLRRIRAGHVPGRDGRAGAGPRR